MRILTRKIMAHNDQEIEIKIPLTKAKFLSVKQQLKKLAKFIKKTAQEDTYFTPIHRNFLKPKYPFEWFSIRKRGSNAELNYKHYYPEYAENHTHCDEYETKLERFDQIEKILKALNIKRLVTVNKIRETYNYKNQLEIALDQVRGLGYFIEIESTKNFGCVQKTRQKLFGFAKSLKIDTNRTDKRGYPYLLMKKKD